MKESLVYLKK